MSFSRNRLSSLTLLALAFVGCQPLAHVRWVAEAPAGERQTVAAPNGTSILPHGRLLCPEGKQIRLAPHPFGLALSPDGKTAVTANSGTKPISITIVQDVGSSSPRVVQVPDGAETDQGVLSSVFMGLAFSPDSQSVFVSAGEENKIYRFDIHRGEKLQTIDCADQTQPHGYLGDMTISRDGKTLYVVDQIGFRLLIVDIDKEEVIARIPTGRYPFGLALSPDEKTIHVANVGMYAYQTVEGYDPSNPGETSLSNPPFAYGSKESIEGIVKEGIKVPGLGELNTPESFSVWSIDLERQKVRAKTKTGILVGEKLEGIPAVGGSSPNSLVATERHVFVSNGNNDLISVIDAREFRVIHEIPLALDSRLGSLKGTIPFGLSLSPDRRRLYVAESGLNAIAVIDAKQFEVLGHIPVGWFPSKVEVTPDGESLVVANAKGFGSGPNGGQDFITGPEGSYIGSLMRGSLSILEIPDAKELELQSRRVVENNVRFRRVTKELLQTREQHPIPLYPGSSSSPIKHIVFVSKENRTYDEVFGQLSEGDGDPSIARYGLARTFSNQDQSLTLENVDVMPNHIALARRFAISDNFYVNADVSADGHRWLACTYPNQWVEASVPAAYGGHRRLRLDSSAPGALAFDGASGALYPEDYNEAGSLWDHLVRNDKDFFNFGFGVMFAPHLSDNPEYTEGYRYAINYPVTAPLFDRTSKSYPTYNMAIPDQFRIDRFLEEFQAKWIDGEEELPEVITVILSNDHGAGERPDAGYPFRESYMADNDLALGRLVEFLSRTKYWSEMAIVVTEDDAQGGVDHVDAHRSLLMVISPYAKRGHISHTHASFGSIFKTFWHILSIPYLNQYDATASDLADLFQLTPDTTPFDAIPLDKRVFDPQKALDPFDEEFDWRALSESPELDDPVYIQEDPQRESRLP